MSDYCEKHRPGRRKSKKRMYLWVWESLFHDWTSGLAVVLAPTIDAARGALRKKIGYDHPDVAQAPTRHSVTKAAAFYVHGGS